MHTAEVVKSGTQFIVPDNMNLDEAITHLTRMKAFQEETYQMSYPFDTFIWDGAHALDLAIKEMYGWGFGERIDSFFSSNPPQLMNIPTGPKPKDFVSVPWGRIRLPNIDGYIQTGFEVKNNRYVFKFDAIVKRKHEPQIAALALKVREFLEKDSIYKGKAIKMRTRDEHGRIIDLPMPEFLDLTGIKEDDLIFSRDIEDAIETNIFTPIDRIEELRKFGIPRKRGVLLEGPFGTGKTLTANVTAVKAGKKEITFFLCENADEFADAVRFAKQYSPAVVFCEDIDRALSGQRTANMNDILNTVDGIESKNSEVMVILTTNEISKINPAFLRPGRLDAVISVSKPDAEATSRLIRLYAKGAISADVDISEAAEQLRNNIPAIIGEAVKRAKISAIKLSEPGAEEIRITPEAMLEAARAMKMQTDILNAEKTVEPSELTLAANILAAHLVSGMKEGVLNAQANTNGEPVKVLAAAGQGR